MNYRYLFLAMLSMFGLMQGMEKSNQQQQKKITSLEECMQLLNEVTEEQKKLKGELDRISTPSTQNWNDYNTGEKLGHVIKQVNKAKEHFEQNKNWNQSFNMFFQIKETSSKEASCFDQKLVAFVVKNQKLLERTSYTSEGKILFDLETETLLKSKKQKKSAAFGFFAGFGLATGIFGAFGAVTWYLQRKK